MGYSPWGHKESDTTEWLILLLSLYGMQKRFKLLDRSCLRSKCGEPAFNCWGQCDVKIILNNVRIQLLLGHFLWQETQLIRAEGALVIRKLSHSKISTHRSPFHLMGSLKVSPFSLPFDSSSNVRRQLSCIPGAKPSASFNPSFYDIVPSLVTSWSLSWACRGFFFARPSLETILHMYNDHPWAAL